MKYDIDVDLSNDNTSHAIVAALVGEGKRVLDVGCSTGYLARILRGTANVVSGVEIDPEAAEQARPALDKLVVGDVESMDFSEHFEAGSFDVIVFADVLEHVREPARVLRGVAGLLAAGGSVVISIPNIAHGSVRLALLEGRFEYRPLGLLDDTHLRFFTRSSLDAMLAAAGFRATDVRRTTADAFETEIPLAEDRFSAEVIGRVRADAESRTYQFVLRAVPEPTLSDSDKLELLAARTEEVEALGAQVRELLALGQGFIAPPSIGVLSAAHVLDDATSSAWAALRASVTVAELRRRLHDTSVRLVAADNPAGPANSPAGAASDWSGEPVDYLGPLGTGGAAHVGELYDALVVADPTRVPAGLAGVEAHGCPVRVVGPAGGAPRETPYGEGSPGEALPDLLVLIDRVAAGTSLTLRLEYLRACGALPAASKYMVVSVGSANKSRLRSLARVVGQLAADSEAAVWVIPAPGPWGHPDAAELISSSVTGARLLDGLGEIDLLAVVAGAASIVTDAAAPAALALSLRRPVLCVEGDFDLAGLAAWSGDPDLVTSKPADLLRLAQIAAKRAEDSELAAQLAGPLDAAFDELAWDLERARARRLASSLPQVLAGMRARIDLLERANAASARRMSAERNALGRRAIAVSAGSGSDDSAAAMLLARAERKREEAEEAARAANEALAAVMATKTMRVLSPARRVYGQLRGGPR